MDRTYTIKLVLPLLLASVLFAQRPKPSMIVNGAGSGGGGGGSATVASQLLDFAVVRTSGTVLTVDTGCTVSTICNVQIGSTTTTVTGASTITLSGGGTGTVYIYFDQSSTLTAGYDAGAITLAGSGITPTSVVTAFPRTAKRIYSWHATAGAWDAANPATQDARSFFTKENTIAGSGLMCADDGAGNNLCSYDDTASHYFLVKSVTLAAGGLSGLGPTAGKLARVTDGNSATDCTSAGGGGTVVYCQANGAVWAALGSGGGSSTAKIPIWAGSFVSSSAGGGSASNASAWQIGGTILSQACFNVTGGNPPETCYTGMSNAAGQNINYAFPWDTNYTAIDLHAIFGQGGTAAGNYRFTAALGCNTLGTRIDSGTWTFGATSTSSTITAPALGNGTMKLTITGIAIPTCAVDSVMVLNLTRDQTVGSNVTDDARLVAGSIIATRTLP
jgi:hypothetical protein